MVATKKSNPGGHASRIPEARPAHLPEAANTFRASYFLHRIQRSRPNKPALSLQIVYEYLITVIATTPRLRESARARCPALGPALAALRQRFDHAPGQGSGAHTLFRSCPNPNAWVVRRSAVSLAARSDRPVSGLPTLCRLIQVARLRPRLCWGRLPCALG